MKRNFSVLLTLALAAVAANSFAAPFTPGNIVVVRVGNGSAALTSGATASFLDEYTTAGVFVQSVAMPTVTAGLNRALTNAGTSTSEGFLNRSTDGQFLLMAGYDAATGTAAIAGTTSAANNRVVGRIDAFGNIDTSTALTDSYSGSNVRSVASTNGTDLWLGGTASAAANAGVRYTTLGGTTAVQLSSTPTNVRVVNIFNNQLYTSSASGAFQGVATVGTGLPTTTGQTTTMLPGMPTATGPSSYDYWFANTSTLYVADDRTAASGGGLQKWTLSSGTWSLTETMAPGTVGIRGLTGSLNGNTATLFATTSDNRLVSLSELLSDTGSTATFNTLATGVTNTAFRGLRFAPQAVPEPGTLTALGLGALALIKRRRNRTK